MAGEGTFKPLDGEGGKFSYLMILCIRVVN